MRTLISLQLVFLQIASLAGCSTPAQEAAYAQHEMDRMIVVYGPACEKLGYASNTDSWRNCIMQLSYKSDVQRNSFYAKPYWMY